MAGGGTGAERRSPFGRPFGRRATDFASQAAEDRLDLSVLTGILRRRLLLFVAVLALCVQVAVLANILLPEQYTATADVVLHPRAEPITPDDTTQSDQPARAEDVETEIAFLTSRDLMGRVFDRLGLARDAAFVARLKPSEGLTPRDAAITTLLDDLDVKRIGNAYALRITYTDPSAERSARVANALARAYTVARTAAQATDNTTAITVLQSRLEQLRQQAQRDFGALQRYRIANNLQSKSATALTEQEISTYNQQVAAARAEASQAASRLAAAQVQQQQGTSDSSTSAVLTALRSQRAQISARLTDLAARYRDNYPDVVAARDQLADIDAQIGAEERRALSGLAAESYAAQEKLGSLTASLGRANGTLSANNAALIAMDDLERKAQASQTIYDGYLARYKEAVARAGAEQPRSEILSPALVPARPSTPNRLLNLVLGVLVGLMLGGGAAIVAESGFNGLTTGDDVERKLSLPYLGSLPLSQSVKPHAPTPHDTIRSHPGGPFAEAVRGLLTAARQAHEGKCQVLAVTSALPGEGKTTVALALAQVSRLAGKRTIVIDCDVVQPSLSRTFGPGSGKPGLREFLAGGLPLGQAAVPILDGVSLLPITSAFGKGERLMQDGRFAELLAALRDNFDLVVLDCPPILPIAETRELVTLADNVIMVTRWRRTSSGTVRAAIKKLPLQTIQDVGAMLNGVDMRKRVRFGGGDSDVFHKAYPAYQS